MSTISNSQLFFSKNISVNDQSFNDTLTNDIVGFEQLGPDRHMQCKRSVYMQSSVLCKLKNIRPQCEKTCLLTCAPSEDSNQPAHSRSLIRVFVVRVKKLCILGYPKCFQWRFWSDYVNAQADLSPRWAHMSEGTFSGTAALMHY